MCVWLHAGCNTVLFFSFLSVKSAHFFLFLLLANLLYVVSSSPIRPPQTVSLLRFPQLSNQLFSFSFPIPEPGEHYHDERWVNMVKHVFDGVSVPPHWCLMVQIPASVPGPDFLLLS